jgi:hypothetical protein
MITWKGKGILVPIVFFTVAFIVSLFVSGRAIIGNSTFMAWTCLISALLLLLIAYASLHKNNNNGKLKSLFSNDTFFFIPVIVWGILCACLSVFFFIK